VFTHAGAAHPDPPSFPPRRSSDLASIWHLNGSRLEPVAMYRRDIDRHETPPAIDASLFPRYLEALQSGRAIDAHHAQRDPRTRRSEEHTSELQSRENLVCRLLLEK